MIVGVNGRGHHPVRGRILSIHEDAFWGLWCVILNPRYAELRRQRGTCPTHLIHDKRNIGVQHER